MIVDDSRAGPNLLVATSNPGKVVEFRGMLPPDIELFDLSDFDIEGPPEIGRTFLDNARIKAHHAAKRSGMTALADDSGLEVDALDGMPGVYSARYAGEFATDSDNNAKLIEDLLNTGPGPWPATFVASVVIATPDGIEISATGELSGRIIPTGRGENGFGYDPHFEIPQSNTGLSESLTVAELTMNQKNRISHRRRAIVQLGRNIRLTPQSNFSSTTLFRQLMEI